MGKAKVISLFNQKGGVGKSDLTNIIANEIILQEFITNNKVVKVLIIDADNQASIYNRRYNDNCIMENKKEDATSLDRGLEKHIESRLSIIQQQFEYVPYSIIKVTSKEDENKAVKYIKSDLFDYIFIDMPGTLSQTNISKLYEEIEYLYIPTTFESNDVDSTISFINLINFSKPRNIISIKCLFNKYSSQKSKLFQLAKEFILSKTEGIEFSENNISQAKKIFETANSFLPISLKANLVTYGISQDNTDIVFNFTNELINL